ncbi:MAG TPA: SsrA-binding protein SmpB [Armatimonadota bacterium]|nr:SsrA-binding protein SmpB [Armatimonadota bacterium]
MNRAHTRGAIDVTPRGKKDPDDGTQTVATNRRARHNFEVLDQLEVGMVLQGAEVKSLRQGTCSLPEAFARIENNELWLHGFYIAPYESSSALAPSPRRPRKLLAHRQEIRRLTQRTRERGYTLVPLRVYFRDGKAKIALGVCKGKRAYDKRETIRRREEERANQRSSREH